MYATPNVNPNTYCDAGWWFPVHGGPSPATNALSGGDMDSGGGRAWGVGGSLWDGSIRSSHFCCEPTHGLKKGCKKRKRWSTRTKNNNFHGPGVGLRGKRDQYCTDTSAAAAVGSSPPVAFGYPCLYEFSPDLPKYKQSLLLLVRFFPVQRDVCASLKGKESANRTLLQFCQQEPCLLQGCVLPAEFFL